ncbi:helix-turn-helix domain-containing protein [Cupriavidus nantongensis]|uniref:helix-turn-helix domain-containing protein n=1 Tax=Cupriavidus nantongensis TaxID=1796606 RepID=UPI000AA98AB3|nr:helix-turn-helix transcriptional regulator [Cupriavidus nantongensis]
MSASDRPLTALKAIRVARNLSPDKLCEAAGISRSYFTRLEQGGVPTPEVAASLARILNSGTCGRDKDGAPSEQKTKLLAACKELLDRMGGVYMIVSEIHLLYPERFAARQPEKDAVQ